MASSISAEERNGQPYASLTSCLNSKHKVQPNAAAPARHPTGLACRLGRSGKPFSSLFKREASWLCSSCCAVRGHKQYPKVLEQSRSIWNVEGTFGSRLCCKQISESPGRPVVNRSNPPNYADARLRECRFPNKLFACPSVRSAPHGVAMFQVLDSCS